jgi:hypothetical protein
MALLLLASTTLHHKDNIRNSNNTAVPAGMANNRRPRGTEEAVEAIRHKDKET